MISKALVVVVFICLIAHAAWSVEPDVERAALEARCTRVVDGDTVVLAGGERVRLLGIDAPELGEPYADDAKWALHAWVMRKPLLLEIDVRERDVYGRLLAHIYVEVDEQWVLVNAELVREGWARLLFIPPNARYRAYFEKALQEAQLQRRGIWGTIAGCRTMEELEQDLVALTNEMVTVQFTVMSQDVVRRHLVLAAEESAFGFTVRIPEELLGDMPWDEPDDVVGTRVVVTGILGYERVGMGPSIRLQYSDQIEWDCTSAG